MDNNKKNDPNGQKSNWQNISMLAVAALLTFVLAVSYTHLTKAAAGALYMNFEAYTIAMIMYFIMTFTCSRILRLLEDRMDGQDLSLIHISNTRTGPGPRFMFRPRRHKGMTPLTTRSAWNNSSEMCIRDSLYSGPGLGLLRFRKRHRPLLAGHPGNEQFPVQLPRTGEDVYKRQLRHPSCPIPTARPRPTHCPAHGR